MMKWYLFILLNFISLSLGAASYAGVELEISPGVGYLTGDTTYAIGDVPADEDPWGRDPYFPISELKFPLGLGVATLDAKLKAGKVSLSAGVRKNFTDKGGNMRDYDWGVPFWDDNGENGPGWYVYVWTDGTNEWYHLDIESKSKTEVDALTWEANVAYQIFSYHYDYKYRDVFDKRYHYFKGDLQGFLGIGYERRTFEYECSLIKQWSPSGLSGYDYTGDGTVGITYDVDYSIPVLELTLVDTVGKFNTEMSFGFCPFVRAKDEDVHLMRIPGPIYAKGDCSGHALKYAADLRYNITEHWFMKAVFDFIYIRTQGESDNVINAGVSGNSWWNDESWTTDERITSRESFFTFNVGYRFGSPDKSL